MRPTITEAQAEALADRRVWRRLSTDHAYRFAETPARQQLREEEIAEQVWREIEEQFEVT